MTKHDLIKGIDPEILLIPDCDAALIGVARRADGAPFAVYSFDLLIEVFMDQGWSYDAALDHICFNIEGSWSGPYTPAVVKGVEP